MPSFPLNNVALYVRDLQAIAKFYSKHFGFTVHPNAKGDKIVLIPAAGGCRIVLLQASKGHMVGQSLVKLIFDVPDVAAAQKAQAKLGLKFGILHRGPNYQFSNSRDPAKNLLQISDAHLVDEVRRSSFRRANGGMRCP